MTSTTTTDPTALTIDGAAATLAALPDSPDVRTAAAMLAAAPTTPVGTLRKWMTAHDGATVDTLQFRTWCGHDTLAVWAPTDRTIDASRAGSVRFNGSTLDYRGVRVIGADDVSIVTLSDEFLTVYRLSSARPAAAPEVAADPAAPTLVARLCTQCDEPTDRPGGTGLTRCRHCRTLMAPDRLYDDGERVDAMELHRYFACDNCDGGGPACGEVSHRGTDANGAAWQRCDDCGPPTDDTAPTEPTDPRPTMTVTNDQGVTFHARLIRTGQRYGLADRVVNDGAAMVELFDAEADPVKFGPLGQFVSRYYVDTFNETAEDGRGIALDGAVPRWTITAANVAEVAAWLASLDTPAPLGAIVAPDKLNAVMEFDHVVTVNEDGTVSDGPSGIYAPDLLDHEVSDPTRWAPVGNYTSQQGGGWLMHNCESIRGQMARDILAEAGTYVAVVAYWSPDENDDHADEEGAIPEGWALFRLIDPAPAS